MTRGDTREEATMGETPDICMCCGQALAVYGDECEECWHKPNHGGGVNVQELQAELAALREIVRALVEYTERTLDHDVHGGYTHCFFCKGVKFNGQEVDHAPDCPILAGRAALADGGEQGGAPDDDMTRGAA